MAGIGQDGAVMHERVVRTAPDVEISGGGGTTTNCDVTWHSTSDDNISGDFNCPDSPAVTITGTIYGSVDIEGSFSATR